MTDLDAERDAVDRALARSGTGWDAWPDVAAEADWTPRERLAALLLLLSTPEHRLDLGDGYQVLPDPGDEVIDRLRRRTLPWDAETARLGLEVVAERGFDDRRAGVVLRAAEKVGAAGGADLHLLDELRAFASWLEVQPYRYGLAEARRAAARALAAAAPPDLLDLTLLADGDRWGPAARDVARGADPEAVAPLVRVLGELGGRAPSRRWLDRVAETLRDPRACRLLEDWLRLAAEAEAGEVHDTDGWPRRALFSPGNEDVVRAAVLAARHVDLAQGHWAPRLLGFLARRGAATPPGSTQALALKVAGAAVDTLAARGGAADREVLAELFEDLTRRDLVRRVGAALATATGQESTPGDVPVIDLGAVQARDEELRRAKAAEVRRRADPGPRRAREEVDRLLRTHVVPALRAAGFTGSGRTWRRRHPDRVDLVHLGSAGEDVALTYGVWFDAAHPGDHPYPHDPHRVLDHQLDVRLLESWQAVPEELDRCAAHLTDEVVPFLDTFAVYELTREQLLTGSAAPSGAQWLGLPGCPAHQQVLGLLALAVRDRSTAVEMLSQQVAWVGEDPDGPHGGLAGDAAAHAFWAHRLRQAESLPETEPR